LIRMTRDVISGSFKLMKPISFLRRKQMVPMRASRLDSFLRLSWGPSACDVGRIWASSI
jgi:hypothetical protein